ncbi:MAG: hypothetical protein ACOX2F_11400 [bacterium]
MKKLSFIVTLIAVAFLAFYSCSSKDEDDSSGGKGGDNSGGAPKCGNGIIEEGEVCDGNASCWQAGHFYPEFEATCNDDCKSWKDTSKCIKRDPYDLCGNFVKDDNEVCEQGETKPCSELKETFVSGDATCNRYCTGWDILDCSSGGTKTCAQLFDCVDKCADETCKETCVAEGSEQGTNLFNALYDCWTSNCASGADKKSCMTEYCEQEYYSCYPSEKCGNGVIDEGEVCEKGNTVPCEEMGDNWQPLNDAVCNSTCSGWDMYSCVDINALTCYQVYECVKTCEDSECEKECIGKTWPAAKSVYDTMTECLSANCPTVTEECMNEHCKFQTDACKTHLTCGNGKIDMYEICEKGDSVDCGAIKDENNESIYEAGTGSAYCNKNCTEHITLMCYRFCGCVEVKNCVETECGGYSNNMDLDCVEQCESWGSKEGEADARGWRTLIQSCSSDGKSGFDSDTCINKAKEYPCTASNHAKCPYAK